MAFLETMAKLIERYNSFFTEGIVNTLIIAAFSVLFGAILGTLMASLRMCRIPPLRWIAVAYIEFVRGTPLMVQLMFIFYGLPMIGITIPNIPWIPNFSRFAAGIVAMSMNSCAYVAEIIRSGIQAVDGGQMEAARSVGFSSGEAMRLVVLPQAIRNILPALGNEFVTVIKESSIVSVIGIADLMFRTNDVIAVTYKNLECLALAGGFDEFPELKREQYFAVNSKNEVFMETLVRYGNRYQADQAAAANSLFGGENVVDIATPEIPEAERWSDLDRLNRERDLVGIYLSAHPLDEYSVVLQHVCNTRMAELEDKAALAGREITMGGIVTSVRRGISKNGNPYGIAKIEDYSGSAELPFFGNDWVTYQGYLGERTFLFIKARCQPKQWRQDELEVKITSMELLPDVKEKLISKITILIPLSVLNQALVTELAALMKGNPGTTELYFKVSDPDSKTVVDMISRPVKLSVGRELISYLNDRPELEFRIN